MLKTLIKKQFMETASFFFLGNRDGKRRSTGAVVGLAALMLYALGAMVFVFYTMADALCKPLVQNGLAWVYFAFTATVAAGLSCVGSVFAAKSKLYEAKDNDLLLSMPLPSWAVLFSRMIGLYGIAFLFSAVAFLPAVVCYFVTVGFSFLPALLLLGIALILPLGVLAVCSLIGWLIALVTARLPLKNVFTVVFFLAFFVAYFVLVGKMNEYLSYVIVNGEAVGAKMKTVLFPFYLLGRGATGEVLPFLGFAGIFLGLFALVYALLSVTFLRVATSKRGGAKAKYREKTHKVSSAGAALLKRESLRFFKNPMIFLNCALGSLFLLMLPVFGLFKAEFCRSLAASVDGGTLVLLVCAIVCGLTAMNFITASSVSLEGEGILLLRALPVSSWAVFKAKLLLHLLVCVLPAAVCAIVLSALLNIAWYYALATVLTAAAFSALCAALGLVLNLKLPNLRWTSEVVAVKQGMSAFAAMFADIGVLAAFVIGYLTFGKYLPAAGYLAVCLGVSLAAAAALGAWLKKRGTRIFENLQP